MQREESLHFSKAKSLIQNSAFGSTICRSMELRTADNGLFLLHAVCIMTMVASSKTLAASL